VTEGHANTILCA